MASLLVAGATGAIGRTVVLHALRDARVTAVVALTRARTSDHAALFGLQTSDGDDNNSNSSNNKDEAMRTTVTAAQLQKLRVVCFDWEQFASAWATRHRRAALRSAAAPAAVDANNNNNNNNSSSSNNDQSAADEWAYYKGVFGGHAYAAMCLGTTRHDAGGAAAFVRCDYDYVVAFAEALLAFSAPAGFAPAARVGNDDDGDGFAYHIGDGARAQPQQPRTATAPPPPSCAAARNSTRTLRALCCVSAMNANASSFLLYPRTKGCVEAAIAERVRAHNACAAASRDVNDDGRRAVALTMLRPGLLHRGDKTRLVERLARAVLPALPVDTCGRCIVQTLLSSTAAATSDSSDMVIYTNKDIKAAAARL